MFQMLPSMTFGRRLSVWWSCMWRQTLASAPVWILGVAIVGLSISRTHSAAGRPPSGGAAALAAYNARHISLFGPDRKEI